MALPVWIDYMQTTLQNVPVTEPKVPEGVTNMGGEWYYMEYPRGGGVRSVDVTVRRPSASAPVSDGGPDSNPGATSEAERQTIMNLFEGDR